jgi:hypothetical protein
MKTNQKLQKIRQKQPPKQNDRTKQKANDENPPPRRRKGFRLYVLRVCKMTELKHKKPKGEIESKNERFMVALQLKNPLRLLCQGISHAVYAD